ncbi:MAG: methionine--tRNA ligase [bacterium]|nr:methionine--tRNA ligase [bacterium]
MKRILVTSALPYANGPIHIGHLAGCYLPADIYVRYQKLKGRDIIHICGTDEHGVLITMKALQEKTTPEQIVNKYYLNIKESLDNFGIKYDNFSRTSSPLHHKTAQNFFLKLYRKGYLTPKDSEQLYCNNCKRFLPERFVEGICPYCNYKGARGDQCEHCGRWLEPTMLKEPKCQICSDTPIKRVTKHWFLRLDLLQLEFESWLKSKQAWKENVISFVKSWLKDGLEPRPVTRDIDWGIPVPLPQAKGKVIYVWFEALIGYISSTIEWDKERWKDYWLSQDTELIHFIGKDNIVFHAIVWPAMLMAHGDFVLPSQIPANEFLNIEGKKISTSRNWAIWLPDYLKNFDPDPLRYILTVNAPERGDVDFVWNDFLAKNNSELSDILGNFVNRTLSFVTQHFGRKIPRPGQYTLEDMELLKKIELARDNVGALIEKFEFKKGMKEIMNLVKDGNKYFDYNKPWKKTERTPTIIYVCTTLIANLGTILNPFLPFTARSIRETLGIKKSKWDEVGRLKIPKGKEIGKLKILFKKIEKERIEVEKRKLGKPLDKESIIVSLEDFKKLDIRVAEIKEALKIDGTDKLLKLRILIGNEEKQIIAGIAPHYSPQELIGKKVVVLTNLEPRIIKGECSDSMLLAATEGDKVVLLVPDKNISSGSRVS